MSVFHGLVAMNTGHPLAVGTDPELVVPLLDVELLVPDDVLLLVDDVLLPVDDVLVFPDELLVAVPLLDVLVLPLLLVPVAPPVPVPVLPPVPAAAFPVPVPPVDVPPVLPPVEPLLSPQAAAAKAIVTKTPKALLASMRSMVACSERPGKPCGRPSSGRHRWPTGGVWGTPAGFPNSTGHAVSLRYLMRRGSSAWAPTRRLRSAS
jgi:hypothetical protein